MAPQEGQRSQAGLNDSMKEESKGVLIESPGRFSLKFSRFFLIITVFPFIFGVGTGEKEQSFSRAWCSFSFYVLIRIRLREVR